MKKITVRSRIQTSPERAWELWTTPRHIEAWNNASDDWGSKDASNDLRKGGKFATTMFAKDGSASFTFGGTYAEVIPNSLIRYAMDDGREVEVSFEPAEGGVLVTETFDPENENPEEMQRAGWQAILDNFKKYAESYKG